MATRLASRVTNLAESATLAVAAKAARMRAEGVDVINFSVGEPDFDTPDYVKEAGLEAIRAGDTKYAKPASGTPVVKRAICEKLRRENGLDYAPEQIIVTAGGKMAVYLAVHTLIEPGDEVLIPVPYWVSYPEIVKLAGGIPIFLRGDKSRDYKLTPEDVLPGITERTKMFIFNSPSNPSGATYSTDEIGALADVLSKHDLIVLSDEIYDRLIYGDRKTCSYAATGKAAYAQTITLNGGSKTYAMTGWRIGYMAGPVDLVKAMAKLQSQSTSGAATFTQTALAAALNGDPAVVAAMRDEFERRGKHMCRRLNAIPGVTCAQPDGAFYCFPDVSGVFGKLGADGSAAFAEKLITDAGCAVVPGIAFGLDEHIRLSYALSMEQIDKGLDRIEALLTE